MFVVKPGVKFTSMIESTKEDWDLITPGWATEQSKVPEHALQMLRTLGDAKGEFPITRLEHSLQTATRAEADGRDEEYILCALLHDIGDVMAPANHPDIAAAILKPFVSEANHWMVANHDVFQGYYFWHHLGWDRNTREKFRGSEYFEYTEEFCFKYDQAAFDPDYVSAPLEHFEPLVHKILSRRNSF